MSTPIRVLAIPGSLRRASHNRALLRAAVELAPAGVEIELYEGMAGVPPFNEDDEGPATPAAVLDLRARIGAADALLIATPEYNHSVPGVLKNAIDWASRPYGVCELVGRPAAVMGASPSPFGATWAQAELRKVLAAAGAVVLDRELAIGRVGERFDADGALVDADARERLQDHLEALTALVRDPVLAA
jgi:chromate reductase, NAD(P)H dehydrogenase (quinone)